MVTNEDLISILMAVYNEKPVFIKKAVDSILNQTHKNIQLNIVIDNPQNKQAITLLESYTDKRINLIYHRTNKGLTKSLNDALLASKGQYCARMDADDIAHKDRLTTQIDYMKKNPDVAICGTWANKINDVEEQTGTIETPVAYSTIKKEIISRNCLIHPSIMINRNIIEAEYDNAYEFSQDYELYLRIAKEYKIVNIPEYLLQYRWLSSHSISFSRLKRQEFLALKARYTHVKKYGFIGFLKLIKPTLSYIIPQGVKQYVAKK